MASILSLFAIFFIIIYASHIQKRFIDAQRNLIRLHEKYVDFPRWDNTQELIKYMTFMKFPGMIAWSIAALRPSYFSHFWTFKHANTSLKGTLTNIHGMFSKVFMLLSACCNRNHSDIYNDV